MFCTVNSLGNSSRGTNDNSLVYEETPSLVLWDFLSIIVNQLL